MLLDDTGAASRPSQMSQAWAAAKESLAGIQQPAQDAPRPKAASQVLEQQIMVSQPEPAEDSGLQSMGWHVQRNKQSHQLSFQQPSLVHALKEDLEGKSQPRRPQQVLRHRPRSCLPLTQGGVAKGIMPFAKHCSGRVSPEKSAWPRSRQGSSALHQYVNDGGHVYQPGADHSISGQHLKPKTAALMASKPDTGRPSGSMPTMSRPAAKACLSAKGMLSSSLQQVQACTALLEQQQVQQQQLQRSVQAMTAKTTAMLDQAILAAVHAQQHADDTQQ